LDAQSLNFTFAIKIRLYKMTHKETEELIDKFLDGETSLEEENQLALERQIQPMLSVSEMLLRDIPVSVKRNWIYS